MPSSFSEVLQDGQIPGAASFCESGSHGTGHPRAQCPFYNPLAGRGSAVPQRSLGSRMSRITECHNTRCVCH